MFMAVSFSSFESDAAVCLKSDWRPAVSLPADDRRQRPERKCASDPPLPGLEVGSNLQDFVVIVNQDAGLEVRSNRHVLFSSLLS
jgi:hypothetical protein